MEFQVWGKTFSASEGEGFVSYSQGSYYFECRCKVKRWKFFSYPLAVIFELISRILFTRNSTVTSWRYIGSGAWVYECLGHRVTFEAHPAEYELHEMKEKKVTVTAWTMCNFLDYKCGRLLGLHDWRMPVQSSESYCIITFSLSIAILLLFSSSTFYYSGELIFDLNVPVHYFVRVHARSLNRWIHFYRDSIAVRRWRILYEPQYVACPHISRWLIILLVLRSSALSSCVSESCWEFEFKLILSMFLLI